MKHNKKDYIQYDVGGIVNPSLQYGLSGAQLGLQLGGPLGAGIGAGAGILAGATLGLMEQSKERKAQKLLEDQLAKERVANDTMRFNNLNDFESPYYMMYGGDIPQYSKGGIYIKPSKRGTFTKAAKERGMGVQEFASKVLSNKEDYSTAMVKKANFARNSSTWRHEMGGVQPNAEIEGKEVLQTPGYSNPMYMDGGYLNNLSSNGYEAIGNSHAEGGIDTKLPPGTRIFSAKLKGSNGKSFADSAKKLEKAKGNAEKQGQVGKNTAKRISKQLDNLFMEQESMKTVPNKGFYQDGGPIEFTKGPNYWGIEDSLAMIQPMGNIDTPVQSIAPVTAKEGFNYKSLIPYASPLLQGLGSYGKKEYLPSRRIDESVTELLPGDREAELMTRGAQARNREDFFTALKGTQQALSSPGYGAVASRLFSDYISNTGDLASQEAQLKANLKSNKVNTLLGIKGTNLGQARMEDENRLMTNANTRNIRRQAFGDISKIAQAQGYEDLLKDRDQLALSAALANADPQVRANYLKQLKVPKSYRYLFE